MTVYVFTGPTLSPQLAQSELAATYLPPVSQGDVYRAALKRPRAIGIIDGYFEHVPAVWHKEILWAMSQGIHVFGSASMGALRAAELAAFGMEGVGTIFKAYHDNLIEDDDEVAVAHGPAEINYRMLSEAMVNIRYTLAAAELAGVVSVTTATALRNIAKALFYPDRTYPMILQFGVERGLPTQELDSLRTWLPNGQINMKRQDALAMLRVMRERLASNPEPKRVGFWFEYTEWWHRATQLTGDLQTTQNPRADMIVLKALLNELRLNGNYTSSRQLALLRYLALNEARRQGVTIDVSQLRDFADTFRRERGLLQAEELELWIAENHFNRDQFLHLLEEEVLLSWVEQAAEEEIGINLLNHLRVTGEYNRLLTQAREKQDMLEGYDNA